MRGLVAGLESPHPTAPTLPAVYQDDWFVERFTAALDDGLTPVHATLDNFASYLDPALAPPDFVDWLLGWVGLWVDEQWPDERKRAVLAGAAALYRKRGTIAGLIDHLALYLGYAPDVTDNGGASWSNVPNGTLPGSAALRLTVKVRAEDATGDRLARLDAVVTSAKPAHVPHRIEVM